MPREDEEHARESDGSTEVSSVGYRALMETVTVAYTLCSEKSNP